MTSKPCVQPEGLLEVKWQEIGNLSEFWNGRRQISFVKRHFLISVDPLQNSYEATNVESVFKR